LANFAAAMAMVPSSSSRRLPQLLLLLALHPHLLAAVATAAAVQGHQPPPAVPPPNASLCRAAMVSAGCLEADGKPSGGPHGCGDCAKAHGSTLNHSCSYDECEDLCEGHVPKPTPSGKCAVTLTKQLSKSSCTLDTTYGCVGNNHASTTSGSALIWAADGCRGVFACGGATGVECDSDRGQNKTCECKKSPPPPPPGPAPPCFTANNTALPCTGCFCAERWSKTELNDTDHIVYSDVYNLSLHLWQPPADADKRLKRPAAVGIHGGGFKDGNRNSDAFVQSWVRKLASRGFVTVSIDYRLEGLTPDAEKSNTDAMYDAKAAVRWLRKHAAELRIDPDRIAALGCSAGAMTTA
jgi:hypothetical protein